MDRLRAANGDDGIVGRVRGDSRLLVAVVGAGILLLAWIAWAIYVASDNGARAGLGVVIAWPAILVALALISLPFLGAALLIRRLAADDAATSTVENEEPEASKEEDEDEDDSDEEEDDSDQEKDDADEDGEDDSDEGDEDEGEDDSDEEESGAAASGKK